MSEESATPILDYHVACQEVNKLINLEQQRIQHKVTAIGLRHILKSHTISKELGNLISTIRDGFREAAESASTYRIDQDSKINKLTIELEKLRSSKGDHESFQKEIHQLKMQVNKLNKQIVDSNLEKEKIKESNKRHRALLESKLDAARRKTPLLEPAQISSIFQTEKNANDPVSIVSNKKPTADKDTVSTPLKSNTPPKADLPSTTKKDSTVRNLFRASLTGAKSDKKRSLFDDPDDDDDDLFNQSISKVAKEHATKKKLISKPTVENEEVEGEIGMSNSQVTNLIATIKGVGSPLKPRTEHQSDFKFKLK
ncbi:hypothetical protein WICPIJ_008131 [Wickerhamomyces pijperi]|uniref:Uncharacterized protein n=1 Tax=Wickerhamomyces pijperi TaxID=599730 RepID=A0A9P8TJ54_WICPI|nr:hypothetical protein WICPIJ_008131 [Wickerhamomyces pijperi]